MMIVSGLVGYKNERVVLKPITVCASYLDVFKLTLNVLIFLFIVIFLFSINFLVPIIFPCTVLTAPSQSNNHSNAGIWQFAIYQ